MRYSNRLLETLQNAKKNREKIFCAFLTLGYPNLAITQKLILEFEKAGVDILELGIPFSDPLADGPVIQHTSEAALRNGVCLQDAFNLVSDLRNRGLRMPIICFSYLNPIHHLGLKRFPHIAKQSGMDGLIIPDLPPEEEPEFQKKCHKKGLSQVYLVTPTTLSDRAKRLGKLSQSFTYYVSLKGVTGVRSQLSSKIHQEIALIKKQIQKPILIGFGISTPEQAKQMARLSDGVIVGSAIMDQIRKSLPHKNLEPVLRYIHSMVSAVKG